MAIEIALKNIKRLRELSKEERELREGWHAQCEVIEALREENKLLQAENEELKKEIKENLHYLACMTEQRNKLKLALEEIREIAKEIDDVDKWIEQNLMPTQVCERIEKINNKIKELLDERN